MVQWSRVIFHVDRVIIPIVGAFLAAIQVQINNTQIQAQTSMALIESYGDEKIYEATTHLTRYKRHHAPNNPTGWAEEWARKKLAQDKEALELDKQRRVLVFWYTKFVTAYERDMIDKRILQRIPGEYRVRTFIEVVEPLEKANCEIVLQESFNDFYRQNIFVELKKIYNITDITNVVKT